MTAFWWVDMHDIAMLMMLDFQRFSQHSQLGQLLFPMEVHLKQLEEKNSEAQRSRQFSAVYPKFDILQFMSAHAGLCENWTRLNFMLF